MKAPPIPNDTDIINKIVAQSNDKKSTDKQYVVDIDLSLFSKDYGIIKKYLIYVRQGKI